MLPQQQQVQQPLRQPAVVAQPPIQQQQHRRRRHHTCALHDNLAAASGSLNSSSTSSSSVRRRSLRSAVVAAAAGGGPNKPRGPAWRPPAQPPQPPPQQQQRGPPSPPSIVDPASIDTDGLAGMFMSYAKQLQEAMQQQQQTGAGQPSPGANVVAKDLGFHPPGAEAPLLSGVNFHLKPNQLGLIIGRSGSGKTTLLQLLAGLSEQTSGDVFIHRCGCVVVMNCCGELHC